MSSFNEFDIHGRRREAHDEVPFAEKDRISQVACVARECKLSYGQLQAREYERLNRLSEEEREAAMKKKEHQRRIAAGWKQCRYCGEYYKPRQGQRYCSANCSSLAAMARRTGIRREPD